MKPRHICFYLPVAVAIIAMTWLPVHASPRHAALLEGFTGWNCTGCAWWNPQEHTLIAEMTRDSVVGIKYHTWWPGYSDDMFYLWNVTENTQRVNFYNVYIVPNVFVDGILEPTWEYEPDEIKGMIRQRIDTESPCTIDVSAVVTADSLVQYDCTVIADLDQDLTGRRLFVALTTDYIYVNPAGTNGEHDFYYPFRDMYPNATTGQYLSISYGETFNVVNTLKKDEGWVSEDLSVIAFVQNVSTDEVLQTNWCSVDPGGLLTMVAIGDPETYIDEWDFDTVGCSDMDSISLHFFNYGAEGIQTSGTTPPVGPEFTMTTSCSPSFRVYSGEMTPCSVTVRFTPTADGVYHDTLRIACNAYNTVDGYYLFPLRGVRVTEPPIKPELLILYEDGDIRLCWPRVTETTRGCEVTVTEYQIWESEDADGPFEYVDSTPDTTYLFEDIVGIQGAMAYLVKAHTSTQAGR